MNIYGIEFYYEKINEDQTDKRTVVLENDVILTHLKGEIKKRELDGRNVADKSKWKFLGKKIGDEVAVANVVYVIDGIKHTDYVLHPYFPLLEKDKRIDEDFIVERPAFDVKVQKSAAPENRDKYRYLNHCWCCGSSIDSNYNEQCPNCYGYFCNECGCCFCHQKLIIH